MNRPFQAKYARLVVGDIFVVDGSNKEMQALKENFGNRVEKGDNQRAIKDTSLPKNDKEC